jgi:hypothetical protein
MTATAMMLIIHYYDAEQANFYSLQVSLAMFFMLSVILGISYCCVPG